MVDPILFSLGILAILSGILTLESKELMHGAFFLGLLLVILGEMYILLGAEYVGLMQILVYGGGVAVIMFFALLFLPRKNVPEYPLTWRAMGVIATLLVISILLTLIGVAARTAIPGGTLSVGELATGLFGAYNIPVLVTGLLLLSVIVSASYIAGERGE